MKFVNLFDTFELFYTIFLNMYNNLLYLTNYSNDYSDNKELDEIDEIERTVIFNEIYKESEKKDNFEKNNINIPSLSKKVNSQNLIDKYNESYYEDDFWNNYFQSE